jgi:hypothetical protein
MGNKARAPIPEAVILALLIEARRRQEEGKEDIRKSRGKCQRLSQSLLRLPLECQFMPSSPAMALGVGLWPLLQLEWGWC